MAMPESVIVGPVRYRITDQDQDWYAWEQDRGGQRRNLSGGAWHEQALILVNAGDHPQVQRVTLLHEIMHAVAAQAGYNGLGKFSEERWISAVSPLLLDTLTRNPAVVAYLLDPGS
jgi:hypothetical protein